MFGISGISELSSKSEISFACPVYYYFVIKRHTQIIITIASSKTTHNCIICSLLTDLKRDATERFSRWSVSWTLFENIIIMKPRFCVVYDRFLIHRDPVYDFHRCVVITLPTKYAQSFRGLYKQFDETRPGRVYPGITCKETDGVSNAKLVIRELEISQTIRQTSLRRRLIMKRIRDATVVGFKSQWRVESIRFE